MNKTVCKKSTNQRSIIFHIPWEISSQRPSGSQIRPIKMLEAFGAIGCEVDVIMGTAEKRRKQIEITKQKIKNGKKYVFLYSESSTFPTIITRGYKDAVKYPLLDFRFFAFCRKYKIPIGLYYRDIHWRFRDLAKVIRWPKRYIFQYLYRFDLHEYKKYVNIMYLQSLKMADYLPVVFPVIRSLPPGCNDYGQNVFRFKENLNVLYVGGIGNHYKMHKLLNVIGEYSDINLTICCREYDWHKISKDYKPYLKSNIKIVHVSGDDLIPLYKKADITSIFVEKHNYWEFVMPLKLYESLGHHKPIVATENTVVGNFVRDNDVGWTIPYDESNLSNLLCKILNNQKMLKEKQKNIEKIISKHTWQARARQVCDDLIGFNDIS